MSVSALLERLAARPVPAVPAAEIEPGTLEAPPLLTVPGVPGVPTKKTGEQVEAGKLPPGRSLDAADKGKAAYQVAAAGDLKPARLDNPLSAPVLALVRCGQCRHFERDTINPGQGLGRCGAGAEGERLPWPNAPRYCGTWTPTPAALLDICRAACDGLAVKPEELARWLVAQDDAQWMTPPAARRWARHINEHGYPKD